MWLAAREAGVVHAVTFNYRGNPMVQQARAMIAAGDVGAVHYVHGATCRTGCSSPRTFWRLEPDKGGASSAVADIGSHWCDLAQHVTGERIVSVLADLRHVVPIRYRPRAARGVRGEADDDAASRFEMRSEDLATILLRFEGGARGAVSVGQVCAGHKNDLWLEVSGPTAFAPMAAGTAERALDRPPR